MPPALVVDLVANDHLDWHQHDHHQLALATRGVLILAVDEAKFVLPRSRALWIPAGVRHAVRVNVDTTMLSLYVDPARCPLRLSTPTVVDAAGLLGGLASHLIRSDLAAAHRSRAEAVLWDLLIPLPVTALSLPMPADDRARRLAEWLLDDLADPRALAEWGRAVGSSAARLLVSSSLRREWGSRDGARMHGSRQRSRCSPRASGWARWLARWAMRRRARSSRRSTEKSV